MADRTVSREPKTCARPGCGVQFVPASSLRLYCSTKCKSVVQRYKLALQGGR